MKARILAYGAALVTPVLLSSMFAPASAATTAHGHLGTRASLSTSTTTLTPAQRAALVDAQLPVTASAGVKAQWSQQKKYQVVHAFNPATEGFGPNGALIQGVSTSLYGETLAQGPGGFGSVYKLATSAGSNPSILHGFAGAPNDGDAPFGGLRNWVGDLGVSGLLYGTTANGGAADQGTVFSIDASGNTKIIHAFNGTDGAVPTGRLVLFSDGNYYGTTQFGGVNGLGTIFKIDQSGNFTSLYSFQGFLDGGVPAAGLQVSINGFNLSGNLYGAASSGGPSGFGAGDIFAFNPATSTLTVIYAFNGGADGKSPDSDLIPDFKGNLIGATSTGGANGNGVIYTVNVATGAQKVLHTFGALNSNGFNADGAAPLAPPQLDYFCTGNLYGTASAGGNSGNGVLFKISPSGTFTTLHNFGGGNDGANPQGKPLVANDGFLYGTTVNGGGSAGAGTVYKNPL